LLAWEQAQLDQTVTDLFGFHALQLGLPDLEGLRANRMPHRWVASDTLRQPEPLPLPAVDDALSTLLPLGAGNALHCDFDALPFPSQSLDLVLLPHTLELARDPHDTLREVERVLVPEGRVIISGFNPMSLWGQRQQRARFYARLGVQSHFLPADVDFIGYWRLRDWLRLLSFEVEAGRFGCYRPSVQSPKWLKRFAWMDQAGARWWPIFGAAYFLVGIKRVRGMRLMGPVWKRAKASAASAVPTVNKTPQEPQA
jgi:SAM-dependent methyltransferase